MSFILFILSNYMCLINSNSISGLFTYETGLCLEIKEIFFEVYHTSISYNQWPFHHLSIEPLRTHVRDRQDTLNITLEIYIQW